MIDRLREEYGTPYPLADLRPFVGPGPELLLEVQRDAALDAELCFVAVANDQLLLTPAVEVFVQRVDWADDIAVGWRPHDDPLSPVRMAPDIRFGKPAIKGITTRALWEHVEAGEDMLDVADAFEVDVDDVRWALAYEIRARAATCRRTAVVRFYIDADVLGLARISSRYGQTPPIRAILVGPFIAVPDRRAPSCRPRQGMTSGFRGRCPRLVDRHSRFKDQ